MVFPIPSAPPTSLSSSHVVPSGDNDALYAAVETCDIVVYDIVTDVEQAKWLVETMQAKADEEWETPKIFICLSTVMTWGRTRKLEASGMGRGHFFFFFFFFFFFWARSVCFPCFPVPNLT